MASFSPRPLLLDWIKLRRPVQKPSQLLEVLSQKKAGKKVCIVYD